MWCRRLSNSVFLTSELSTRSTNLEPGPGSDLPAWHTVDSAALLALADAFEAEYFGVVQNEGEDCCGDAAFAD